MRDFGLGSVVVTERNPCNLEHQAPSPKLQALSPEPQTLHPKPQKRGSLQRKQRQKRLWTTLSPEHQTGAARNLKPKT